MALAYDYAREKLLQAAEELVGDGSIQHRLALAARYLNRIQPDEELPENFRKEFKAVYHELTKEKAVGDEGSIEATTRKLSPEEGSKLARRILGIHTELNGEV